MLSQQRPSIYATADMVDAIDQREDVSSFTRDLSSAQQAHLIVQLIDEQARQLRHIDPKQPTGPDAHLPLRPLVPEIASRSMVAGAVAGTMVGGVAGGVAGAVAGTMVGSVASTVASSMARPWRPRARSRPLLPPFRWPG